MSIASSRPPASFGAWSPAIAHGVGWAALGSEKGGCLRSECSDQSDEGMQAHIAPSASRFVNRTMSGSGAASRSSLQVAFFSPDPRKDLTMNTIQRTSSMLRRIAIAGLGAASLWTASLALAAIAPSTPAVLGGLQATVRARVSADALPTANAPLLVAPNCPGCRVRRDPAAATQAEPQALPAPILVAPCPGGCMRPDIVANLRVEPAALRIADGGCRDACTSYPTGPVSINPQPLPPQGPDAVDASAGRALLPRYPATLIGINPQPLPPGDSRSS